MFLAKSQISNKWFACFNEKNTNHHIVLIFTLYITVHRGSISQFYLQSTLFLPDDVVITYCCVFTEIYVCCTCL
jgi:hypothetical protein